MDRNKKVKKLIDTSREFGRKSPIWQTKVATPDLSKTTSVIEISRTRFATRKPQPTDLKDCGVKSYGTSPPIVGTYPNMLKNKNAAVQNSYLSQIVWEPFQLAESAKSSKNTPISQGSKNEFIRICSAIKSLLI